MNFAKKLLASSVAASVLAVSAVVPTANAEVSGSVGIASTYFWRGYELGSGTPVVWGDLSYSAGGFYAGVWVSSGDTAGGTEYDLYLGYGGEVGDFFYDVSLASYIYPTGPFSETDGSPGDFVDAIVTLGFGPVSLTYKDIVAGDTGGYALPEDYSYLYLAGEIGSFTLALGQHDGAAADATHFDVTYGYNDNLAFTASAILDSDADTDPEPTFVVSYSIPIGE